MEIFNVEKKNGVTLSVAKEVALDLNKIVKVEPYGSSSKARVTYCRNLDRREPSDDLWLTETYAAVQSAIASAVFGFEEYHRYEADGTTTTVLLNDFFVEVFYETKQNVNNAVVSGNMDYSKCLIDLSVDEKQVLDDFSGLHDDLAALVRSREDGTSIPILLIVKFIVLCYDKESPLREAHKKRWTIRKKTAATDSGLMDFRKKSRSEVDAILYGRNAAVNKAIVRYLSLLYDRDFMAYAVYAELLVKQYEELIQFKFDNPSHASKAKSNVESLQKDLTDLEEKIFGGGDVKTLSQTLDQEARAYAVSELRPENIVSKLEKGEPVVDDNPYGTDYFPDEMRFIGDN